MKFLSLRKQFETPCITDIEPNEMLPKLKEAIKDHTLYELAYITRNIS